MKEYAYVFHSIVNQIKKNFIMTLISCMLSVDSMKA